MAYKEGDMELFPLPSGKHAKNVRALPSFTGGKKSTKEQMFDQRKLYADGETKEKGERKNIGCVGPGCHIIITHIFFLLRGKAWAGLQS